MLGLVKPLSAGLGQSHCVASVVLWLTVDSGALGLCTGRWAGPRGKSWGMLGTAFSIVHVWENTTSLMITKKDLKN